MKKITHPKCCGCGAGNPKFNSERFPALRVCYRCLYETATWFDRNGLLLDSNPLVTELFDGVFEGGILTEDRFQVWCKSDLGQSASYYKLVRRFVRPVDK